jgi:hypothetical protein
MATRTAARWVVRFGALFDVVFAAPVAIPYFAARYIDFLYAVNTGVGSTLPHPEFGPVELIFANMFGAIICVWAFARLRETVRCMALYDMYIRLAISAIFATYAVSGVSPVVMLFFLACNLLWGVLDWQAWRSWDFDGRTGLSTRMPD